MNRNLQWAVVGAIIGAVYYHTIEYDTYDCLMFTTIVCMFSGAYMIGKTDHPGVNVWFGTFVAWHFSHLLKVYAE